MLLNLDDLSGNAPGPLREASCSYYYTYKREGRGRAGSGGGLGGFGGAAGAAQIGRVLEFSAMVLQNMFSALSFLQCRHDDDFADRMSYFYTSSFLIMMAVLVSFKQVRFPPSPAPPRLGRPFKFGGRPLECWVPAEFTHSWEAYTEMYCWAQNTYFVPFEFDIPQDIGFRESLRISYYQWVPFFLLIQALLFYMPCLLWRLMNDKSGIRLHDIVSAATEKENIEPEFRAKTIASLSRHVESCLKFQHALKNRSSTYMHRVFKCLNLRYYDSYVTGLYLAIKLLYIGNIFLNLLILNKFLETDNYSVYGFGVIRETVLLFPCVLVINIFNEKIFILLWLWFSFLLVVTFLDSLYWFSISVRQTDRMRFLMRHLELTTDPKAFRKKGMRKTVKLFLSTYIKVDGVLILRMLAVHAGVMFCTELTEALWHRFLDKAAAEGQGGTSTEEDPDDDDSDEAGPSSGLTQRLRSSMSRAGGEEGGRLSQLIQRKVSKSTALPSSPSAGGGVRLTAARRERQPSLPCTLLSSTRIPASPSRPTPTLPPGILSTGRSHHGPVATGVRRSSPLPSPRAPLLPFVQDSSETPPPPSTTRAVVEFPRSVSRHSAVAPLSSSDANSFDTADAHLITPKSSSFNSF